MPTLIWMAISNCNCPEAFPVIAGFMVFLGVFLYFDIRRSRKWIMGDNDE
ncbi:hypothetical protein LCGC14_1032030 [marine sediment metagenome]|uniref:Uncharacterized protein n=1 Tax=marine sediment metagenome TaxID=412755 RepID=A0A0F9MYU8_9ZZZZ